MGKLSGDNAILIKNDCLLYILNFRCVTGLYTCKILINMKNKRVNLFVSFILISLALHSQSYTKGDLLLSLKAGIIKMNNGENIELNWQGTPVSTSIEYMILNRNKLTLGLGLDATYFRHQLNSKNFGILGIGAPVSLHYNFFPRITAYAGYMPGWYFDGYKPEDDSVNSGYGGLYSEMFLGLRYFVVDRLAVFTQVSSGDFMLSLGVSIKL